MHPTKNTTWLLIIFSACLLSGRAPNLAFQIIHSKTEKTSGRQTSKMKLKASKEKRLWCLNCALLWRAVRLKHCSNPATQNYNPERLRTGNDRKLCECFRQKGRRERTVGWGGGGGYWNNGMQPVVCPKMWWKLFVPSCWGVLSNSIRAPAAEPCWITAMQCSCRVPKPPTPPHPPPPTTPSRWPSPPPPSPSAFHDGDTRGFA